MKYATIHGHFYQPPRENPWTELVAREESAAPFADWNRRITAECYRVNGAARILDSSGTVAAILNNYSKISFNVGPTLLAWLEVHAPSTYRRILSATEAGSRQYDGHLPAIAQAYNHVIMPLANERDRSTQVLWGIEDYKWRFGARPEGMWLPETAVDYGSLEVMAANGIRFTILEPGQIARVRTGGDWVEGAPGGSGPWECRLPSGRSISIFVYDGTISRAIAFEGLLQDGGRLARRIVESSVEGELFHAATDGESYGHHHRNGEMALARALIELEADQDLDLTVYGAFLAQRGNVGQAEIREGTSWSCAHGIERWRSDCGCRTGGAEESSQGWRAPLRTALDWLRDSINAKWENTAREYYRDPWASRDAYIKLILDRSERSRSEWFESEAADRPIDMVAALEMMELQRHLMLMYTSCGWFFHDVAGIETVQILRYAARAVELAERRLGLSLEEEFATRLQAASSNDPSRGTAADVYEEAVARARVTHRDVAAFAAFGSGEAATTGELGCWSYEITASGEAEMRDPDEASILVRNRVTTENRSYRCVTSLEDDGGVTLSIDGERIPLESLPLDLVDALDSNQAGSAGEGVRRLAHLAALIGLRRRTGTEVSESLEAACREALSSSLAGSIVEGPERIERLLATSQSLGIEPEWSTIVRAIESRMARFAADPRLVAPEQAAAELESLRAVALAGTLEIDLWELETLVLERSLPNASVEAKQGLERNDGVA